MGFKYMIPIFALLVCCAPKWGTPTILPLDVAKDVKEVVSVAEFVRRNGYPCEEHEAVTEDGYILPVQRLPNPGGAPVILQHGLLDHSLTWVVSKEDSLPFLLHDLGHDVWLTNSRGKALGHESLDKSEAAYYEWSLDELAEYDLPALVDLALSVNGAPSLSVIGHSQGAMMVFASLSGSRKSELLRRQINFIGAVAPAGNFKPGEGAKAAIFHYLPSPSTLVDAISSVCGRWIGKELCARVSVFDFIRERVFSQVTGWLCDSLDQCDSILVGLAGGQTVNFDKNTMVDVFQQYPVDTSLHNLQHLAQMDVSGKFRKFDYGPAANFRVYGDRTPPSYSVDVDVPTALYYGVQDRMLPVHRFRAMAEEIRSSGNLVDHEEFHSWGHAEFVWGISAHELLYPRIIKLIQRFASTDRCTPIATSDPFMSPHHKEVYDETYSPLSKLTYTMLLAVPMATTLPLWMQSQLY